jgi:hypothetical protein
VAILDLENNTVEYRITTGRVSIKTGQIAATTALQVFGGFYGLAASYALQWFPRVPLPNPRLASSADGAYVYALNLHTNDVTIIRVADGWVVDKLAVGFWCKQVALAPGGRFVYSYTPRQFNLIDTASNQEHLEYRLESGRINTIEVLERDQRLVMLTTDSVIWWDAEKGAQSGKIGGLHEPWLLVEPK